MHLCMHEKPKAQPPIWGRGTRGLGWFQVGKPPLTTDNPSSEVVLTAYIMWIINNYNIYISYLDINIIIINNSHDVGEGLIQNTQANFVGLGFLLKPRATKQHDPPTLSKA